MTAGSATRRLPSIPGDRWAEVRRRLHERGLRWTSQRGVILDVLARVDGHVTGATLVDRCRQIDPSTTPSTVYRTLDVLEELGLVSHSHGPDGRTEFHVRPSATHGHLVCSACGGRWDLAPSELVALVEDLERRRGFAVSLEHLSIEGRCEACRDR